jgi:hypothetical protein
MSKLQQLEQRVKEKIQQAKDEMFPGHIRTEIDTLNWVLNEISLEKQTTTSRGKNRVCIAPHCAAVCQH